MVIGLDGKYVTLLLPLVPLAETSYFFIFINFFFFFFFCFLGPHPRHMEVPRPGVDLELQLLASATATPDLSHICNLHSLRQCWILNALSKAKDRTCVLTDASQVLNPLSHKGNSKPPSLLLLESTDIRLLRSVVNVFKADSQFPSENFCRLLVDRPSGERSRGVQDRPEGSQKQQRNS